MKLKKLKRNWSVQEEDVVLDGEDVMLDGEATGAGWTEDVILLDD